MNYSCISLAACTPTPGQPGDPEKPCIPTYNPGTGLGFVCEGDDGNGFDWGYGIQAWANIPPHNVRVYPFPRWLVGAPGMLSLTRDPLYSVVGGERGGGEGGFWSQRVSLPSTYDPDDPPPGTIRDYSIGVRWRMVFPGQQVFAGAVPESCWNFDERPWNIAGGYAAGGACGDSVVHTYETSSFGLTANGPRFDYAASGCAKVPADWTLPAYQVTVPTYWSVEWADEWWEWTATGTQWSACQCVGTGRPSGIPTEGCTPPPGICHLPGEWYGKIGEPRYEWIHHFVGWYPIDLREYGESAWYATSFRVVTEGEGGDWCPGTLYTGGPGNAVPVPVIESQAIIVDPCRLNGACGDLNP